jgi:hypothetical protein
MTPTLIDAPVMCAWTYVDGSTAPHGAHPRRASNGHRLCEQRDRRLGRAPGKLHVYGSSYICNKCYQQIRREQLARTRGSSPLLSSVAATGEMSAIVREVSSDITRRVQLTFLTASVAPHPALSRHTNNSDLRRCTRTFARGCHSAALVLPVDIAEQIPDAARTDCSTAPHRPSTPHTG